MEVNHCKKKAEIRTALLKDFRNAFAKGLAKLLPKHFVMEL